MQWENEPRAWQVDGNRVTVTTQPKSDFWRKTLHDFIAESGHFYFEEVAGDFTAAVTFVGKYKTLYDQAGLMVRVDAQHWMKCGIEYVHGVQYASAVVTRDFSDWSTAPLSPAPARCRITVKRMGTALEVYYAADDGPAVMIRQAYLPMGDAVQVGLMACSPGENSFEVEFVDYEVMRDA